MRAQPQRDPPIEGNWESVAMQLRKLAGGRCECTGECGENHNWEKHHPPLRCRAAHGATIQRKTDNPSFWMAAGTERIPIAYPGYYRPQKVDVVLDAVALDGKRDNRARTNLKAMCQRCKKMVEGSREKE